MQQLDWRVVALVLAAMLAAACSREPAEARGLKPLSVEMTVKQRSTTPVPGSEGELCLTIDDITRNQVMVSLAGKDRGPVLAPVSLSPGTSATFKFGGGSYLLTLKKLENALIGDDFGTFVFSSAAAHAWSESAKIERLIQIVAGTRSAVFIRNGIERTPWEAAEHLRGKWLLKAGAIGTATQFIDLAASRSSASGEPYQVRLPNGRLMKLGDFLRERLAEIEQGR